MIRYGSGPSPNSTSSQDSCSFGVIDISSSFHVSGVSCFLFGVWCGCWESSSTSPSRHVFHVSSWLPRGWKLEAVALNYLSLIHKINGRATCVLNEEFSGYRHSNIRQGFSPLIQIAEIGIVLFVFITSRDCQWNIQFLFQALELC